MMKKFNPYHSWLGIPPKEQPPNHYRLLGVSLFESDREVIRNGADQRMTYLKTFGAGQHSTLSQDLLNEVSAAKVCLLNEPKKRAYDEQLRKQTAPSSAAQPAPAPQRPPVGSQPLGDAELPWVIAYDSPFAPQDDSGLPQVVVDTRPSTRTQETGRPFVRKEWAICAVVMFVLFILGASIILFILGASIIYERNSASPPPKPPGDGWIDALELVDIQRHRVNGDWERRGPELLLGTGDHARSAIPVLVEGSYDLNLEFTRTMTKNGLDIVLPVGDRACLLQIGGGETGIHLVDGKHHSFTSVIATRRRYVCSIRVRDLGEEARITVNLNGEPHGAWQGMKTSLSFPTQWAMPNVGTLGFGANFAGFEIHSLYVRAVSEKGAAPGKIRFLPEGLTGYQPVGVDKPDPDAIRGPTGNWYLFPTQMMTFPEAQSFARSRGGRLVLINSDEEDKFIDRTGKGKTFLGLLRQGRSERYLTDALELREPGTSFFNWRLGQPELAHEILVAYQVREYFGQWHDYPSNSKLYVCVEWGPESEVQVDVEDLAP